MKESYIQTSDNGKETLVVFYDNQKANYDEMEALALKKHGLPKNNKLNIICLPDHSKKMPLFSHDSS